MTTGSKVLDRTPFSKYTKNWSGTDYAGAIPDVFQAVWKKIDAASHTEAGKPKLPFSYLRVWEKRRLKPRSTRVDHPYSMDLTFWTDTNIARIRQFQTFPPHAFIGDFDVGRFRAAYGGGVVHVNPWNSNDTIALQGKLREKIVGSDFDMGVFLGEGQDTLKLLSQSVNRLYGAYLAVRRCDPAGIAKAFGASPARVRDIVNRNRGKNPTSAAQNASQAWLELQYGWMPLVQDVHGAACALAQQLNEPAVQNYRVRMKKKAAVINLPSINIKTYEAFGQARAQLIARVKEVDVAALNGLADPASVLWELTPWSFVADWAIPIGNYLAARGLASAVSGTFVTTVTFTSDFYTESGLFVNAYNVPVKQYCYREYYMTVVRTVSSSLQTPRPQVKPLGEIVSWKRAANAVALLVTTFSGKSEVVDPRWSRPPRKLRIGTAVW